MVEKLAFGFIKLSILFFFRRVFSGTRKFDIMSWTLIAVTGLWMLGFFLATVAECNRHASSAWSFQEVSELYAKCVDINALLLSFTATDVAIDLAIFSLPLPNIWRLNMQVRKKIAVSAIFLLGSL